MAISWAVPCAHTMLMPITLMRIVAKNMQSDSLGETFLTKVLSGKYLKEKCYIEHYQQLSFKYFVDYN